MAHAAAEIGAGTPYVHEVEQAHLHPLWDRYKRITPMQPRPADTPFHWPVRGEWIMVDVDDADLGMLSVSATYRFR
jgi:hypothetical protein